MPKSRPDEIYGAITIPAVTVQKMEQAQTVVSDRYVGCQISMSSSFGREGEGEEVRLLSKNTVS